MDAVLAFNEPFPHDDIDQDFKADGDKKVKTKSKSTDSDAAASNKRRCVSTACIACRRRKSKCDGAQPACAACASVYMTDCEYAPHTDHRRKGVYKKDVDSLKTKNSTLQVLVQAILNSEEEDVAELVRQIRTCDNLEDLAASIEAGEKIAPQHIPESPVLNSQPYDVPQFESELSGRMGDLWLDGSVKFIGGTSNLIWLPDGFDQRAMGSSPSSSLLDIVKPKEEAVLSWTTVTQDKELILHFLNMYFCWHYAYFTTLSKELFYRDFLTGTPSQYCSALLVNVMLALGCHFSNKPAAKADPEDSSTTGDHYFREAKRLLHEDDEFANAKLCTVQALALMSVREAGCGRESKGWVYSGMSFRMANDLGLNIDAQPMNESSRLSDEDIDARRITFWGCFLFDKCWSNYLGRQPQLQSSHITVKKPDVFPSEDSERWSPYTDSGIVQANAQPARTRTVALQLSTLAEISGDLLASFYHPNLADKPFNKQNELKRLSDIHTRLEAWKKDLPGELEVRDAQLPQVLLMHMFYQLLYIHLYRPFLRYTKTTSPLPSHVSPRKYCTQAAGAISKLFRLYKRTHGLRQICNIAIYILHTACTIHILNLPDKNARRDITHGVKHLEEMGDCWTAARRTLEILRLCAEKWKIDIPEEADAAFARGKLKWGLGITAPSPTTANTYNNLIRRIGTQPFPDQNLGSSQQQGYSFQQSMPYTPTATLAHLPPSLSTSYAPSAASTSSSDPKRTSLTSFTNTPTSQPSMTKPPPARHRPSTHLTSAQQDAWNMHTARLASNNSNMVPSSSSSTNTHITSAALNENLTKPQTQSAAHLFGGVDSLLMMADNSHSRNHNQPQQAQNQDEWWVQDQTALAAGFGNWGTSAADDWSKGSMYAPDGGWDGQQQQQQSQAQFAGQITGEPARFVAANGNRTGRFGGMEYGDEAFY